jgi:FtsH-binding integral membrane protein
MTSSPAIAATQATSHGAIPSPVTILLAVAAVGYVLWSRMKGQPLQAKRLLILPAVLTVLGATDLTGHLTSKDIAFLVASAAISAVLGAARGATIQLYAKDGELWQRYRPITAGLWLMLIVFKLIMMAVAHSAGASAGGGSNGLLLTLGVSLLAEAAIVGPRAVATGLPFAANRKDPGVGRRVSGRVGSRDYTGIDGHDHHHHHDRDWATG